MRLLKLPAAWDDARGLTRLRLWARATFNVLRMPRGSADYARASLRERLAARLRGRR